MDEIKIGEYGRTNKGKIIKFAWLEKQKGVRDKNRVVLINKNRVSNNIYYFNTDEKIVKHSKNIIDLIEVGDYVNGSKVTECTKNYITIGNQTYDKSRLKNIKSLVTHEQFKNIEYRVEE